ATFRVLNQTYPNLTEECWLCYVVRPPFYEAIALAANHTLRNGTNPPECVWNKTRESPGISLTQVRGSGTCIG
ncbi:ENV2 protein, partial [Hemiprocne comata]|nr:ENV2 protein [Hemiprocne comata]